VQGWRWGGAIDPDREQLLAHDTATRPPQSARQAAPIHLITTSPQTDPQRTNSIFMGNIEVPAPGARQPIKTSIGTYEFGANVIHEKVGDL
jgi:hypothetical protein